VDRRDACAGLRKARSLRESAGIVPTPAVDFSARTHGFQAGVVLSDSHNPCETTASSSSARTASSSHAVELAMEEEILHHAATIITVPNPESFPLVETIRLFSGLHQFLIDSVLGFRWVACALLWTAPTALAAAVAPELFRRLTSDSISDVHAPQHRAQWPQHSMTIAVRFIQSLWLRKWSHAARTWVSLSTATPIAACWRALIITVVNGTRSC